MKRKIIFVSAIALAVLVSGGCKTVSRFGDVVYEVESTPIDSSRFDVLGPVSLEEKANGGACYIDIFSAAKTIYPDADEIINIHVDYKENDSGVKTVMTGLAIRYHR